MPTFAAPPFVEERSSSLSQLAYQRIQQKLVTLEFMPGDIINEITLQNDLGLGRTPVREALQRLAREQLVQIVPRRGIFVTKIDFSDLQRLYEMRVPLEGLASQLAAARGSSEHWKRMATILDHAANLPNDQHNAWISLDHACHEIIYEASANKFLSETLESLYALSLRLWYYALPGMKTVNTAVLEHQAIHSALAKGNSKLAGELMEEHIRSFQKDIETALLTKLRGSITEGGIQKAD